MLQTIEVADREAFKERMKSALQIDPATTVAVTIDMQREYLDEAVGQAVVLPEEAERVLASTKRLLDACRDMGIPVVHAYVSRRRAEVDNDLHSGGLVYMRLGQSLNVSQLSHRPPRERPDRVEGSPEAEVPGTLVAPEDIHVTTKKSLDSFFGTDLDFLLRRTFGAQFLLLAGINTDTCVYSTAFTAANIGYAPVVVSDCVASMRGVDSHKMALELISRSIGWVLTLEETLAHLS
ncbi:MAG: isochorismatase family protein [Actinobacteria bacterium]|nr:isochorismatase family protein [Actinomycetota bacterium]